MFSARKKLLFTLSLPRSFRECRLGPSLRDKSLLRRTLESLVTILFEIQGLFPFHVNLGSLLSFSNSQFSLQQNETDSPNGALRKRLEE